MKTALVLSGGGARAAYQVGVLKAVSELLPATEQNPFQVICGTSSGAINAAKLASEADDFQASVKKLENIWSNLRSHKVHRVGFGELLKSTFKLLGSFFRGGVVAGERPLSLFDNGPLSQLLADHIDLSRLDTMVEQGKLHALCISALGYSSGNNISFFQGNENLSNWKSARRTGVRAELTSAHILASSALPAIFPAVRIDCEYFGDGALRQTAPLSAALNLGAEKLFVIGVSGNVAAAPCESNKVDRPPALAEVLSQLLNSAFIDSLEEDINMVNRYNSFIECMNQDEQDKLGVRPVETLVIEPSIQFDQLAGRYTQYLPRSMRVLLKTIGANPDDSGSSLASYILFEREYCLELMAHGYRDAMQQSERIRAFVGSCEIN